MDIKVKVNCVRLQALDDGSLLNEKISLKDDLIKNTEYESYTKLV